MEKILSVFIDESGDSGFEHGSSKFYIVCLVFHDQTNNIAGQLNKLKNDPVFHAGPLIRREGSFQNTDLEERKRIFNRISIFYTILPIKHKEFIYNKKEFELDEEKTLRRLTKDIYLFLRDNYSFFSLFEIIKVYYDKGQQIVSKALIKSFYLSGYPIEFKRDVKQEDYRLAQIADYITSIRLTELKINSGTLSKSEERFFENKKVFKRVYLRSLNKKEF